METTLLLQKLTDRLKSTPRGFVPLDVELVRRTCDPTRSADRIARALVELVASGALEIDVESEFVALQDGFGYRISGDENQRQALLDYLLRGEQFGARIGHCAPSARLN